MSLRTSANRYAKALFDVALEEKADLAKVDQDLQALVGALMEAVSKAMSLSPTVTKMLVLLSKSGKLNLVPELAAAYRGRLLSHQNVVRADVTSAAPLSPEETRALEESLSEVTGKKVELSLSVDPELLGGVVATIGST